MENSNLNDSSGSQNIKNGALDESRVFQNDNTNFLHFPNPESHQKINIKTKNLKSILTQSHYKFWITRIIMVIIISLLLATCSFKIEKLDKNIEVSQQAILAKEFLKLVKANKYVEIDDIAGPEIKYNPFAARLLGDVSNTLQGVNIDELQVSGGKYAQYGIKSFFEPKKWYIYFTNYTKVSNLNNKINNQVNFNNEAKISLQKIKLSKEEKQGISAGDGNKGSEKNEENEEGPKSRYKIQVSEKDNKLVISNIFMDGLVGQ